MIVVGAFVGGGDETAPPGPPRGGPPGATAAPTGTSPPATRTLTLPRDCTLFDQFAWGDPRAGEPVTASFVASACASRALDALGEADAPLTLALRRWNDDTETPATLVATLPVSAGSSAAHITWAGDLTFPEYGAWRPLLRVAGIEEPAGPVAVAPPDAGLVTRPGLPAPSTPGEQLVVTLAGDERARWPSAEAAGTAWLADPARAVFVQSREGVPWVVAGDPATGEVEPLFEAGPRPLAIVGSPAGNAFAAFTAREPYAVRVYSAADGVVRDLDTARDAYPVLAWSPGGGTLIELDTWLRVFDGDGRMRVARQLSGSGGGRILWSPDGAYALVQTWDGLVFRLAHDAADAELVFDTQGTLRLGELAISPDGGRVALTYTNEAEHAHRLAVVAADGARLDDALAAHVIADFPYEQFSGWLASPAWSPDGRSIAVAHGARPDGANVELGSALIRVDVATGATTEIRRAERGYYLWAVSWTADGDAIFAGRAGCYGCDGAPGWFDLVDAHTGDLIATVDDGYPIAITGDVRIVTGGRLSAFDATGTRRPLVPADTPEVRAAVTSPGGLVAVALGPGSGAVFAIDSDPGTDVRPTVLGAVDRSVEPLALLDAHTLLGASGTLARYDLATGRVTPLEPDGTEHGVVSISPERRRALVVQSGGAATLRVLDLSSGDTTRLATRLAGGGRVAPAWSADGARVAVPDGAELALVEVAGVAAGDAAVRIDLAAAGVPPASRGEDGAVRLLAIAWSGATHVDVLTEAGVWRVEAHAGGAAVRLAPAPDSGLSGVPVLTRSPDGRTLALVSAFGAYALDEASGSWRELSRVGVTEWLSPPWGATATWAPDSSALVYAARDVDGGDDLGVIVVPVDGSGAYRLLTPALNRLIAPLAWLDDGRIVYASFVQGI